MPTLPHGSDYGGEHSSTHQHAALELPPWGPCEHERKGSQFALAWSSSNTTTLMQSFSILAHAQCLHRGVIAPALHNPHSSVYGAVQIYPKPHTVAQPTLGLFSYVFPFSWSSSIDKVAVSYLLSCLDLFYIKLINMVVKTHAVTWSPVYFRILTIANTTEGDCGSVKFQGTNLGVDAACGWISVCPFKKKQKLNSHTINN